MSLTGRAANRRARPSVGASRVAAGQDVGTVCVVASACTAGMTCRNAALIVITATSGTRGAIRIASPATIPRTCECPLRYTTYSSSGSSKYQTRFTQGRQETTPGVLLHCDFGRHVHDTSPTTLDIHDVPSIVPVNVNDIYPR